MFEFIDLIVGYIQLKFNPNYLTKISEDLKNIKPLWYFASEEFIKIAKILLLSNKANEDNVIDKKSE